MARHTPSRERRALCRRPRAPQVAFAVKLADAEFGEGDEIIRTGALCDLASPNLYLISNGQAEVKVDGRGVRRLQSPFMIGDAKMLQVRRAGQRARGSLQRILACSNRAKAMIAVGVLVNIILAVTESAWFAYYS